jgi:hypothetical protein
MCRPSTVIRLPARRSDSSLVAKKAPKEFGQLVTARKGHESALRSDLYLTWAETMTEADTVSRKIDELKKLQTLAWRRIADPLLTPLERREIRNHIKESDLALRYYLTMMSKRLRFHPATVCKCRQ